MRRPTADRSEIQDSSLGMICRYKRRFRAPTKIRLSSEPGEHHLALETSVNKIM